MASMSVVFFVFKFFPSKFDFININYIEQPNLSGTLDALQLGLDGISKDFQMTLTLARFTSDLQSS